MAALLPSLRQRVIPLTHTVGSHRSKYNNRMINICHRTALSAAEPRRRLPIQVYAIKRDVSKMQHTIANADFEVKHFPFFVVGFSSIFLTYAVCYVALDPDKIAECQVEINMYGYKIFIEHLMDPYYVIGGSEHDDDEDDNEEWEYIDENEPLNHDEYEYEYEEDV